MVKKLQISWDSNLRKIIIKYDGLKRKLWIVISNNRDNGIRIGIRNSNLITKTIWRVWLRFRFETK